VEEAVDNELVVGDAKRACDGIGLLPQGLQLLRQQTEVGFYTRQCPPRTRFFGLEGGIDIF